MSPIKKNSDVVAKLGKYRHLDQDPPDQDGSDPPEEDTCIRPDTAKVLEAIKACLAAVTACQMNLTTKIEKAKVNISLVRQDFQKLRERESRRQMSASAAWRILSPPPEFHRRHAAANESITAETG